MTHVYNDVAISRVGGGTRYASDKTSRLRYGRRPYAATLLLNTDDELQDAADYLLGRYREPMTRVERVVLEASSHTALWPPVLIADVGTRADVTRRAPWGTLTYRAWIESVDVEIVRSAEDTRWTVTYGCSPADVDNYLILDDPVYGLLDLNKWSY